MSSINEEIREIEQEIAKLYRRKRVLEEEQRRQLEKLYPPMTALNANNKDSWFKGKTFEEICQTKEWQDFANEPSGTLLG